MSQQSPDREFHLEQERVDHIYHLLDSTRQRYRKLQQEVEAEGAQGSPQNRSERDAMAAHYGDEAARLEQVDDRLVFGRLDHVDKTTHYIGRVGLSDTNGKRALIDWRAPAATAFYQATVSDPKDIVRRRHIGVHQRKVVSIDDDVFNMDLAEKMGAVLQGEGALLAALNKKRSAHMPDIVATIQFEQDKIIRSNTQQMLVVQGGPGTGKTAVALHRAAYLLYEHQEQLKHSGVLIVGPSATFLSYIDKVLPSLGETGVVSVTPGRLIPGIVATKRDSAEVGEIKGRIDWVKICRRVVQSLERIPKKAIELRVNSYDLFIYPEVVQAAADIARNSAKRHNARRPAFVDHILNNLVDQYLEKTQNIGLKADDRAWMYEEIRQNLDVRRHINLLWLPVEPVQLLQRLFANPDYLHSLAPELSQTECRMLYRPKDSEITVDDIPIIDEIDYLVGTTPPRHFGRGSDWEKKQELKRAEEAISNQNLGQGIVTASMIVERTHLQQEKLTPAQRAKQDASWSYGHIVVDEAQELRPLAWNCLLRRCPSRSMTIVGDLAQQSGHFETSWEDVLGPAARALEETAILDVCYRTPQSIMDLAEDVMAAHGRRSPYPVKAVRDIDNCIDYRHVDLCAADNGQIWKIIDERYNHLRREGGTLAVIVPDSDFSDYEEYAQSLGYDLESTGRIASVINARLSKGLEYDDVIIVDPAAVMNDSIGDIFVALTRPTQHLTIIYSQDLPAGFHPPA